MAAFAAETLPLQLLYRGAPFLTISEPAARDLVALGHRPPSGSTSGTSAWSRAPIRSPARARRDAALLYLGRLKRYKRIELLLDVSRRIPDARARHRGRRRPPRGARGEIAARGLGGRVVLHGHVDEGEKAALLRRARGSS